MTIIFIFQFFILCFVFFQIFDRVKNEQFGLCVFDLFLVDYICRPVDVILEMRNLQHLAQHDLHFNAGLAPGVPEVEDVLLGPLVEHNLRLDPGVQDPRAVRDALGGVQDADDVFPFERHLSLLPHLHPHAEHVTREQFADFPVVAVRLLARRLGLQAGQGLHEALGEHCFLDQALFVQLSLDRQLALEVSLHLLPGLPQLLLVTDQQAIFLDFSDFVLHFCNYVVLVPIDELIDHVGIDVVVFLEVFDFLV